MHMGVWSWRRTVWWNPAVGVTPAERDWLEEKYPGWNSRSGRVWDVTIDNLLRGDEAATLPETLPLICHRSNLLITHIPGDDWDVQDDTLEHEGRLYHFGSEVDRWCFEIDPGHYKADFPLYSNFQGDFVPKLVLVDSEDNMAQVAQKCAYHSVGKHVAPQLDKVLGVCRHCAVACFPTTPRVSESALKPTEIIDVVFADS